MQLMKCTVFHLKSVKTQICFAEVEYADMEDYHKMQGKIKGYDFVKEDVTENERFYVKNIWRQFCGEQNLDGKI